MHDLWKDSRARNYVAPTQAELREAEALFVRLFQGEQAALVGDWMRLGYRLQPIVETQQRYLVLHEDAAHRRGRGFFVFLQGDLPATALQAPHSFKDRYTGTIGLSLMVEGKFSAGAWNTVPRHYENDRGHRIDADVAHLTTSYFTAFGRAFARVFPRGRLVQLHGFAQEKRKTKAASSAQAIISAASVWPSRMAREVAHCFRERLVTPIRLYPDEVTELGGTTNTTAKDLRAFGFNGFVHVELSAPIRKKIRKNATMRKRFSACLAGEKI